MDRATWIPSYDEWRNRAIVQQQHHGSEHLTYNSSKDESSTMNLPVSVDVTKTSHQPSQQQVTTPVIIQLDPSFELQHKGFLDPQRYDALGIVNHQVALETAQGLASYGLDFLYGMLFRETFALRPSLLPPEYYRAQEGKISSPTLLSHAPGPPKYGNIDDKTRASQRAGDIFSLALHSRHPRPGIRGNDISNEIYCLNQLLNESMYPERDCIIYLLSDRNQTIHEIRTFLSHNFHNCRAFVASKTHVPGNYNTSSSPSSPIREHGPFSGLGFFQDLVVAAHARSGFIGHERRSSSTLLLELIEYDRHMEAQAADSSATVQGQLEKIKLTELRKCWLPHNGRPSTAKQRQLPKN